jgi:hypothetical protein
LTGLLFEQLTRAGYSMLVIDPEGDYRQLQALPGVTVREARHSPRPDILDDLHDPNMSLVVDLSKVAHREKPAWVRALLTAAAARRSRTGLPHKIVLDEAHYFLNEAKVARLLDLHLRDHVLVTYRASSLSPEILRETDALLMTRETELNEVETILSTCSVQASAREWASIIEGLGTDEAVLLPGPRRRPERPQRFRVAPRLTAHVRHRTKYFDVPFADGRAFVFSRDGKPIGTRARTLKDFAAALGAVPSDVLDGHLRRQDFSRWIREVFYDEALATEVWGIEERCSREGSPGDISAIVRTIRDRYEVVKS